MGTNELSRIRRARRARVCERCRAELPAGEPYYSHAPGQRTREAYCIECAFELRLPNVPLAAVSDSFLHARGLA